MKLLCAGTVGILLVAGCAKNSEEVSAAYVPPLKYSEYDCQQLSAEAGTLSSRIAQAAGEQDEAATRDAVAAGVGLVLFWPALFFLAAGDNEEELARLKGEFDAVEREGIRKDCAFVQEIDQARAKAAEAKAEDADDEPDTATPN